MVTTRELKGSKEQILRQIDKLEGRILSALLVVDEPAEAAVRPGALTDEEPTPLVHETALLSEAALSDWNRPEEDAAWAYLQREQ